MTEVERREHKDIDRFVTAVMWLPRDIGFSITRPMQLVGAPELANPYTCILGMDGSGRGTNPTRHCEANGATMYEALMRALADAHEQKAINIRVNAGLDPKESA